MVLTFMVIYVIIVLSRVQAGKHLSVFETCCQIALSTYVPVSNLSAIFVSVTLHPICFLLGWKLMKLVLFF